jgi:hypothetical protein
MAEITSNLTVRLFQVRNLQVPAHATDAIRNKDKHSLFVRQLKSDDNQKRALGIYCKANLRGVVGAGIARTKRVRLVAPSLIGDASLSTGAAVDNNVSSSNSNPKVAAPVSSSGSSNPKVAAPETFDCFFGEHEVHYWHGVSRHSLHGFEVLNLRIKLCRLPTTSKHKPRVDHSSAQHNNNNRHSNHRGIIDDKLSDGNAGDSGNSDCESSGASSSEGSNRIAPRRMRSWFPMGKKRKPVIGEVSIRAKEAANLGSAQNLAWYPLSSLDSHGNLVKIGEVQCAVYWQLPVLTEREMHGGKQVPCNYTFCISTAAPLVNIECTILPIVQTNKQHATNAASRLVLL